MHLKEENLTENHTIPISEIHTKQSNNEENSSLVIIGFSRMAKMKVETSSLRNLKIMPRKPQRNRTFMNSISVFWFNPASADKEVL
jgi:hypothetical protein